MNNPTQEELDGAAKANVRELGTVTLVLEKSDELTMQFFSGSARIESVVVRLVWTVGSGGGFKGEHYAVYPLALVEPMIKAGTSEYGVCGECGKPWERVYETFYRNESPDGRPWQGNNAKGNNGGECFKMEERTRRFDKQLGWRKTCKCASSEVVPALVLDPFSGMATTGICALRLGRRYLGLELNEKYAEMSRNRIIDDAPLFNSIDLTGTE